MTTEHRKLATIMFTDMVGYSALSQKNERLALELLDEQRSVLRGLFAKHGGREIEAVGDGFFVEFASAFQASECAIDVQQALQQRNQGLPSERHIQIRIGLHLGDVVVRGDRVHGDGVNIAARIEPLAEPGGICLSEDVARQIQNKIDLPVRKLGKGELKNIRLPVDIYRLVLPGERRHLPFWDRMVFGFRRRRMRLAAAALVAAGLIGGLAGVGVYLWPRAHDGTDAADPVLALPKGPAIAVLPFVNLSGDLKQDYFVDGITEDIISALVRFDLRVIARNSAFQYKGRAVDVREVGRKLGARYVLEGSVRRAPGSIRVSAQLLDAETGAHLWAQNFDRELTASSIFVVQNEITSRVVAAIAQPHGGVISLVGAKASAGKDTDSLSAYDCVLQAYEYWRVEGTNKKHLEVRECLERTVHEHPKYSQAWAMLADNYIQEFQTNRNKRPDWLERASRTAHRAVDLEPNNYTARYALAHVYFFQRDLARFFAEADRALELNPHDPTYLAWLGVLTAYAGRWQRGLALADKSVKLNPDYPSWLNYLWFHDHYRKGEYQQAVEKMLNVVRLEPGNFWPHVHLAQAYGQLGRKEDAAAEIKKLLAVYPNFAKDARATWKAWNQTDEYTEMMLDGLRKAGLDIPDQP